MDQPPEGLEQCLQDEKLMPKPGKNVKKPVANRAKKTVQEVVQIHEQMSKGHLAANADFVAMPERTATFCFLNAAPQWQITNAGNFATVENYARQIVHGAERHLDVYTGTHGDAKVLSFF